MSEDKGSTHGSRTLPQTLLLENVSPATRLLEKRRQMFEVQEALDLAKQEFARKEAVFRLREEALKKKDLELQESLIRFSRFLQDNDAKRARAEKRAADEVKGRLVKEREVCAMVEALEGLREEREAGQAALQLDMRYTRYLESVLEASDEFSEVADLLGRHATLAATHDDLAARQAAAGEALEAARAEMAAYTKQRADEVTALNNRLAGLQAQLEALEGGAADAQALKDRQAAAAAARMLARGRLLAAADNLYARVLQVSVVAAHQRGSEAAAAAGPLQQLEVVGNYIGDLVAACRQARRSGGSG